MRQCSMLAVSELLSIFGVVAFLARRQFSAVGLGILCFSSFHFVYAEPLLAEKAEKNKLESKERPRSTSKFFSLYAFVEGVRVSSRSQDARAGLGKIWEDFGKFGG